MDIKKIKVGEVPNKVNVFIEIPKDGNIKYELDKESGIIFVDRFLHTAMSYPFNYGFIPNTLSEDGDPIDVLVLGDQEVMPGTVIPSKIIGMLEMTDEAGIDTKIIAVPTEKIDPSSSEINDISEVSNSVKNKIKHFFENYKTLESGKWVKIKDWKGQKEAVAAVNKA
ncbi:MAG: inorganic diphosphatase, partial [Candidatus Levybacteria bacterium]|nr:inorganic diphosphatase [Candidatus Levybacteria bacterium]